jgi:hypothetical protein
MNELKGMDDFDDCKVRAVARANAYRDCAKELEDQCPECSQTGFHKMSCETGR